MAVSDADRERSERTDLAVRLKRFSVDGLFGYLNHTIEFPQMDLHASIPEILIVEGQNGTGKTTIMKMIDGIVNDLVFDTFRNVPFRRAELELSTGDVLGVESDPSDLEYPIVATFRDHRVPLARERESGSYNAEHFARIDAYRTEAMPLLRSIDFELLTIDRSISVETKSAEDIVVDKRTGQIRPRRKPKTLAGRVHDFLREAQVNYRRYFQADELELLPRLLRQLANVNTVPSTNELLERVYGINVRNSEIQGFGLQSDDQELQTLISLLESGDHGHEPHALSLLASYVEIHENRSRARELIATRLSLFESIMDDFFVGKRIRVSAKSGFEISGSEGKLTEKDLSSGEFHFLYMMVAALLCERTGSIIAIDEPELSLHISWQRRLIGALSKCASGASPLFFVCTHSTAISSAHRDAVQTLSAID